VSELPGNWGRCSLAGVAHVVLGQSPPGSSYNDSGRGVPFFQGKTEFTETYAKVRKFTTAGSKFAMAGDILLSVRAPVGPTNYTPVDCAVGRGLAAIRAREGIDQRYLFWALRATEGELASHGAGSTFPAITGKQLCSHKLNIAPIAEQRRIVDILEDHLSRLDTAMDGMSTVERRACAMVTASAVHQVSAAGLNSPVATVGQLALLVEYGSGAKTEVRDGSGFVPVLRMGNIKEGAIDWSALKFLPTDHPDFPKLLLQTGDLLFNRTNSAEHVGKSAVFDAPFNASFASYLIRVRFDETVLPQWANIVINSPQGRNYVSTVVSQQVGQANVNGTKLKAFPLVVPLVQEQLRRVTEHQRVVEAGRTLRIEITRVQGRAGALRRALLAAAFSGKLTGRHTDEELIEELAQ